MAEKQGKSHKKARSTRNKHKYERQWSRTGKNKLKRINYQHKLAGRSPERGHTFKGKNGEPIYIMA